MQIILEKILLAFIPLFVALDPIGLVPIFLTLTQSVSQPFLNKIARQATLTASVVAIVFMFLGKAIFAALGISVYDFKIAGGIILLGLAVRELLGAGNDNLKSARDDIAVVPLGLPLIAGPATITSLLILIDSVGVVPTLIALMLNLTLIYLGFRFSQKIKDFIGVTALRACSKIVAMLLAAIAVSMILKGIKGI